MQHLDREHAKRFLEILVNPGDVFEIRMPKTGRTRTVRGYFNDPAAAADALKQYSGKVPSIYVTLNPVEPSLLARAFNKLEPYAENSSLDNDIVSRRWLLIDIDAKRASGISSSDAEHEAALKAARQVFQYLRAEGWPTPIAADSGNGAHLLYRIDLPNDGDSKALIENALKALAHRFDDDQVSIDTSVSNAARISKVYGTMVCKGDNVPDRPHRLARILNEPSVMDPVPIDQLQAMAALMPEEPKRAPVRQPLNGSDYFKNVNDAAMGNIRSWVTSLFPSAKENSNGVYRVSSKELKRDNEEDLSISPNGIKDFGVHDIGDSRGGSRTPIDLVIEWNHMKEATDAAEWLCRQMGTDPGAMGWRGRSNGKYHESPDHTDGPEKPKRKTRKPNETKQPAAESLRPDVPTIKWISGKLPECVDQAELALIALQEPQLYQRDKMLVQVVRLQSTQPSSDIKRDPGALVIVPAADAQIRELFCRSANWLKYYKREDEWSPINCPKEIVETYKGRVGRWGIPPLSGIIEAPTLRDDGSILETPGYDPASRLYFDPGVTKFPPIPQNPTKQDADDALEILIDIYKDFPLVGSETGNESHSVALSSVLTALVRKSLRTAPLHAFDAPVMASGKSLLARVCSLIATGRPPSTMNHVKDVDEERKRMLSVLMAGDPVICIDNISGPCNSDALCTVLTERTFDERILGASQMGKMPTGGTWLATGNNLQFAGDLTTRVVICRIDPAVEKPEERTFDRNLEEYIPRYRSEIVVAALTILRAYHVAGRPKQNIKNFGRFEDWSDWVRSALVWLGQADPVSTRQWIAESDPEKTLLTKLFTSWYLAFEKEMVDGKPAELTVKDIVVKAKTEIAGSQDPAYPEFKDALEEISNDRDNINSRKIGQWLKKYKNRIADGKKLSGKWDTHSKQWKWFIEICG